MAIKVKKSEKQPTLKKTFSNRRESINWENSLNDSLEQWEDTKEIQKDKLEKQNFEFESKKREEEVKIKKQKIFIAEMKKESIAEEESLSKRFEIDEKIRTKKRKEMKKRDIAFRNKSIYG
ncbi:MAG: hypothetical protein K2I76_04080 [Malacoplasma sp.]|nr:hypothetical protein [Malacoplasma sp.]